MRMNKQKQYRLAPLIWLALVLLVTGLLPPLLIGAENDPLADDQTTTTSEDAQAESSNAETNTQQAPQTPAQTPSATGPSTTVPSSTGASTTSPAAKPLKNFKPSEEIGADSAVSFPIDI
jgi:hypothetical protein